MGFSRIKPHVVLFFFLKLLRLFILRLLQIKNLLLRAGFSPLFTHKLSAFRHHSIWKRSGPKRVGCSALHAPLHCHVSQLFRAALDDNLMMLPRSVPASARYPFCTPRSWLAVLVLTGRGWMLHVVKKTSQDVALWFIFKLQAAVKSVFQAVALNYCFSAYSVQASSLLHFMRRGSHACNLLFTSRWLTAFYFIHTCVLVFSVWLMCVFVCVSTAGHQCTEEELVAAFDKFQAHLCVFCLLHAGTNLTPSFVCNHRFPSPSSHPLAPSHSSAPFLTLTPTTGVIRKPSRDQFFPHSLLFFSPSACSVSLCWLLSRHSGTLACQRDIDWKGEGAEVLQERLSAHKRLCVFVRMWKCLCVCMWEEMGKKNRLNREAALIVVVL